MQTVTTIVSDMVLGLIVGASATAVLALLLRSVGRWAAEGRHPRVESAVADFDALLKRLSAAERTVIAKIARRQPVARDTNKEFSQQLTLGERVADQVARFGGSWPFIWSFLALMAVWMLLNEESVQPFDPYPFILLNLVLSCLAALQAPIIMMSQNRQAVRDRLEAKNDYEVNLKAELEILALHEKVDRLHADQWREIFAIQERQIELLRTLESRVSELPR
jgi:uncharacterized membrane protein